MTDEEHKEALEAAVKAAKEEAEAEKEAALKEAEEAKEAREKLEADMKEREQELEKLRSKDMNFKKLRDLTDKEKEKLTAKDRELMERQEKVEEDARKVREEQLSFYKRSAIAAHAGSDEELAKSIGAAYDEFAGDVGDQASVEARVLKAARLVRGEKAVPTPASAFSHVAVAPNMEKTKVSYADTDEGKNLAARLGLHTAPPEKK